MKTRGLRILDNEDNFVNVLLSDLLCEIPYGEKLNWSIVFLDAIGDLGMTRSTKEIQERILSSENGLRLSWKSLLTLSRTVVQLRDLTLQGSLKKSNLKKYPTELEMYESCDIVIEMFDSSYWEVFSKDHQLIDRLAGKFKEIEWIEPDFQERNIS